jgi:cation diffusion facilitator family transporter
MTAERGRERVTRRVQIALASIVVALLVLGLKYFAYLLTGSVALYSDALESLVNVAAAVAAFIAVRLSAMPADANHPYGHEKAEYLSAVAEGALIVVAALMIFREAYFAYLAPRTLEAPVAGLAVNAFAGLLNGIWCWVLIREGRRRRSPALLADGRHLLTDVVSSAGVLAGLLLALATGWMVLDPLLAALVAVNVLWSGGRLMRESLGGLMDEAASPEVVERIRHVISKEGQGALEAHDLRTRHAGRATFVDFHLVVPGRMSVTQAHDICDRIERALKDEIGQATITIHVEPDEKAKHSGIVVL